jgi:hypothetical protein
MLRFAWRLQHFELVVILGLCLLLAAAAGVLAVQLTNAQEELVTCYRTAQDSAEAAWPCRPVDAWLNQLTNVTTIVTGIGTAAPFLAGLFLGTPIVAREVERGTAPIAWSLSPSRLAWLARRALPVAVSVGAVLLLLGAASEAALSAVPPNEIDFRYFGMHGPLLAVRGLSVFAVGLAVGMLLGRTLPAILATGLIFAGVLVGLHVARYELMAAEAVWIDTAEVGFSFQYVHESGFRDLETGEHISFDEAYERFPESFTAEGDQQPPGTTLVMKVNPPEQYGSFVAREGAALALITLAASGATAAGISRRRPH